MMVPVATSHSHFSEGAVGDECRARKTWHPQVEQKYLVDAGETE
jgi:hypothetical protein